MNSYFKEAKLSKIPFRVHFAAHKDAWDSLGFFEAAMLYTLHIFYIRRPLLEGPPGCGRWELFVSTVKFSLSTGCFFILLSVVCYLLLMICNYCSVAPGPGKSPAPLE